MNHQSKKRPTQQGKYPNLLDMGSFDKMKEKKMFVLLNICTDEVYHSKTTAL